MLTTKTFASCNHRAYYPDAEREIQKKKEWIERVLLCITVIESYPGLGRTHLHFRLPFSPPVPNSLIGFGPTKHFS